MADTEVRDLRSSIESLRTEIGEKLDKIQASVSGVSGDQQAMKARMESAERDLHRIEGVAAGSKVDIGYLQQSLSDIKGRWAVLAGLVMTVWSAAVAGLVAILLRSGGTR